MRPPLDEIAAADRQRLDRTRSSGLAVKAHGCVDKRRYGKRAARTAARILRERTAEEIHHYPCQFCHSWHVGHDTSDRHSHTRHHASSRTAGNHPS